MDRCRTPPVASGAKKLKILIAEDDPGFSELLKYNFEKEYNSEVFQSFSGNSALEKCLNEHFDIILLDWMLPGLPGIEILRRIRLQDSLSPIIMLTARSEEDDRIRGLNSGANDYVTKPFSWPELMARCNAVMRSNQRAIKAMRANRFLRQPEAIQPAEADHHKELLVEKFLHDLKGTITHIQLLAARIAQLGANHDFFSAQINSQIEHLLVSAEFLKVTTLKNGALVTAFPINTVLQRLQILADRFKSEHSNITSKISNTANAVVLSNPDILLWILQSYISNAVRHGRKGDKAFVELDARIEEDRFKIFVRDSGGGLVPEIQKRVFFEPVNLSESLGIDLFLVAQLAEEIGAEYGHRNLDGEGAEFWISPPLGV